MICATMFDTEENEERSMIEPHSFVEPKLKELIAVLIEWINDELADHRIIVKDIEEDLYDGQVLQKLLGKLLAYGSEHSKTLHKLHHMIYFMYSALKQRKNLNIFMRRFIMFAIFIILYGVKKPGMCTFK